MNDHGLNKMVNIPAYNYFITFFLSKESLSGCVWIGGWVGWGRTGIICSGSPMRLFCKTKRSSQTLIEKYSAVRRKFINWHQLMCALFISGEHEKWSKEVWNCRRTGWLHSGWGCWFVSSYCRGVWAERWRAGETEGCRMEGRSVGPFFWTVGLSSNSCATLTRGRQQHRERGCLGQMDQHHLPSNLPTTTALIKISNTTTRYCL